MAIHWDAMTYDVIEDETVVHYFVQYNTNVVVSMRVCLEPIAIDFHTHTNWEDFLDGCMTIMIVTHLTTLGVRVSLT